VASVAICLGVVQLRRVHSGGSAIEPFLQQRDARDDVFVKDAHLTPGFLIAPANLGPQLDSKLAQVPSDLLSHCGEFLAHFDTKGSDFGLECRHAGW
jgi:hypothetical protein